MAVVAVGGTVAGVLLTRGGGDSVARYGQDPVGVIRKLHMCDAPDRFGDSTARCTMPDGQQVTVTTSDSKTSQEFFVAIIKDQDAGKCFAVVDGVVIGAADEGGLTEAIGIPEAFTSRHRGYLLCPA